MVVVFVFSDNDPVVVARSAEWTVSIDAHSAFDNGDDDDDRAI